MKKSLILITALLAAACAVAGSNVDGNCGQGSGAGNAKCQGGNNNGTGATTSTNTRNTNRNTNTNQNVNTASSRSHSQSTSTAQATGGTSNANAQGGSAIASGGQATGGAATAAGGNGGTASASGGSGVGQVSTVIESPKPAAQTAYAPPITPTANCMKSTGLGVQAVGGGISFGSTDLVESCDVQELAKTVYSLGDSNTAREVLCQHPLYRQARKNMGDACKGSYSNEPRSATMVGTMDANGHVVQ